MLSRTRLFKVQYRLYQHLKRYRRRHLGKLSQELQRYYLHYQNDFKRYKRVSSKHELIHQLKLSSIVMVGDYHTLPQAQRMLLRLLRELGAHQKGSLHNRLFKIQCGPLERDIQMHFEMFEERDRSILEKFSRNEISVEELWRAAKLHRSWPFPKNGYWELLKLCQSLGISVHPLSLGRRASGSLKNRDKDAARYLVDAVNENPEAIHIALIGDMHLAETHLPQEILRVAKTKRMPKIPTLVIHQNHEDLYWRMVFKRKLDAPNVVEIKPRTFCVFGSPPWVKLQSHIRWAENLASAHPGAGSAWNAFPDGDYASDLIEDVSWILEHMVSFLGVKPINPKGLSVSGPSETQILLDIQSSKILKSEDKKLVVGALRYFKGMYVPQLHHLYLRDLSLNPVSALTGIFLYCELSGAKSFFKSPHEHFFHFVWREALGFLGSKLVNSRRKCYGLVDYSQVINRESASAIKGGLDETNVILRRVLQFESSTSKMMNVLPREVLSVPQKLEYLRAAKLLGKTLGEGLFRSMVNGESDLDEIRRLFHNPFEGNEGVEGYYHWIRFLDRRRLREFSRHEVL